MLSGAVFYSVIHKKKNDRLHASEDGHLGDTEVSRDRADLRLHKFVWVLAGWEFSKTGMCSHLGKLHISIFECQNIRTINQYITIY